MVNTHAAISPGHARSSTPAALACPKPERCARNDASTPANRQIAQRLYLSPRTVEAHLSRILAKLDVTTRSAVAPAMIKSPPRPTTWHPGGSDPRGTP